MFTILGIAIVLIATMVGYVMHGGNIAILIQINEFIVIGGAGLGSFMAANGMKNMQATMKSATSAREKGAPGGSRVAFVTGWMPLKGSQ